jgi:hypothetical protein
MEAPMKRGHFIGIDVHCQFCEIAVVDAAGKVVQRERCVTTVLALLEVLRRVPPPRQLVIEEGPLAGWLWRHLRAAVERMVSIAELARSTRRAGHGSLGTQVEQGWAREPPERTRGCLG